LKVIFDLESMRRPETASEAALVRRYSTSRITVGRAFRELVQKGWWFDAPGGDLRTRRPESQLANGRLFGLLIPDLGSTEIFEPICQEWLAPLTEALVWGSTATDAETREEHALALCHQYISQRISGVFFAPLNTGPKGDGEEANLRIIAALEKENIPVVLINRDIFSYPKRSKFDLVGIDNRRPLPDYRAPYRARLPTHCFISYPNPSPTVKARIAGFAKRSLTAAACSNPVLSK